jgi:hypothetical protein
VDIGGHSDSTTECEDFEPMPLTHFICPDGERIDIGSCLQHCRMGRRCLTLPTLLAIVIGERPWEGKPSITRLINGTMLEFLKNTVGYASEPRSRAYALLGNDHHRRLALLAEGNVTLAEQRQGTAITGVPDVLEQDEQEPGVYVLTDYKTFGSYRVAKMLGMRKRQEQHPTEVYRSSGRWGAAGSPKKVNVFYRDENFVDMWEEELQLNGYRLLLQEQGYPISRMQIQVTVRDGGLQVARERGITEAIYVVDVKRLPDEQVFNIFEGKRQQLEQAMLLGKWDVPCNDRESWEGRRCQDYCEVAECCSKGKIELQKKVEKANRG